MRREIANLKSVLNSALVDQEARRRASNFVESDEEKNDEEKLSTSPSNRTFSAPQRELSLGLSPSSQLPLAASSMLMSPSLQSQSGLLSSFRSGGLRERGAPSSPVTLGDVVSAQQRQNTATFPPPSSPSFSFSPPSSSVSSLSPRSSASVSGGTVDSSSPVRVPPPVRPRVGPRVSASSATGISSSVASLSSSVRASSAQSTSLFPLPPRSSAVSSASVAVPPPVVPVPPVPSVSASSGSGASSRSLPFIGPRAPLPRFTAPDAKTALSSLDMNFRPREWKETFLLFKESYDIQVDIDHFHASVHPSNLLSYFGRHHQVNVPKTNTRGKKFLGHLKDNELSSKVYFCAITSGRRGVFLNRKKWEAEFVLFIEGRESGNVIAPPFETALGKMFSESVDFDQTDVYPEYTHFSSSDSNVMDMDEFHGFLMEHFDSTNAKMYPVLVERLTQQSDPFSKGRIRDRLTALGLPIRGVNSRRYLKFGMDVGIQVPTSEENQIPLVRVKIPGGGVSDDGDTTEEEEDDDDEEDNIAALSTLGLPLVRRADSDPYFGYYFRRIYFYLYCFLVDPNREDEDEDGDGGVPRSDDDKYRLGRRQIYTPFVFASALTHNMKTSSLPDHIDDEYNMYKYFGDDAPCSKTLMFPGSATIKIVGHRVFKNMKIYPSYLHQTRPRLYKLFQFCRDGQYKCGKSMKTVQLLMREAMCVVTSLLHEYMAYKPPGPDRTQLRYLRYESRIHDLYFATQEFGLEDGIAYHLLKNLKFFMCEQIEVFHVDAEVVLRCMLMSAIRFQRTLDVDLGVVNTTLRAPTTTGYDTDFVSRINVRNLLNSEYSRMSDKTFLKNMKRIVMAITEVANAVGFATSNSAIRNSFWLDTRASNDQSQYSHHRVLSADTITGEGKVVPILDAYGDEFGRMIPERPRMIVPKDGWTDSHLFLVEFLNSPVVTRKRQCDLIDLLTMGMVCDSVGMNKTAKWQIYKTNMSRHFKAQNRSERPVDFLIRMQKLCSPTPWYFVYKIRADLNTGGCTFCLNYLDNFIILLDQFTMVVRLQYKHPKRRWVMGVCRRLAVILRRHRTNVQNWTVPGQVAPVPLWDHDSFCPDV